MGHDVSVKRKSLDDGRLRLAIGVTPKGDETYADVIPWAVGKMLDAMPENFRAARVRIQWDDRRNERGWRRSRRVQLTLIADPRPPTEAILPQIEAQ